MAVQQPQCTHCTHSCSCQGVQGARADTHSDAQARDQAARWHHTDEQHLTCTVNTSLPQCEGTENDCASKLLFPEYYGKGLLFPHTAIVFPTSWILGGTTKSLNTALRRGAWHTGSEAMGAACRLAQRSASGGHQPRQHGPSAASPPSPEPWVWGQGGFLYIPGQAWPRFSQPFCC